MKQVTVLAPAKLNLALDIVGLFENGYHDLDMVMQAITLYERITLQKAPDIQLELPGSFVAANEKNTAYKAARMFLEYTGLKGGVKISVQKRVPVRAGMAGGRKNGCAAPGGKNGQMHRLRQMRRDLPAAHHSAFGAGKSPQG